MNCLLSVLQHIRFITDLRQASKVILGECPTMTATVKIYDIASKVHTKGFQVSISWYGLTFSLLFTVVYYLDRVLNLFSFAAARI